MSTEPFPPQPEPGADRTPPASSVPPPGYEQTPPAGYPPFEPTPGGPAPSGTDRFFASVRRSGLTRSDDRWVGGVAGGIAERLGWDPLLVRGLLFVSFFLTGVGLIVYAAGWALLPERRDGRIHLEQAIRGDFDSALIGVALVLVAGLGNGDGIGWGWGWGGRGWIVALFWLAVWGTAGWFVFRYLRGRRGERPQGAAPVYPMQSPGGDAGPAGPAGPGGPGGPGGRGTGPGGSFGPAAPAAPGGAVPFAAASERVTSPVPGTTAEPADVTATESPAMPSASPDPLDVPGSGAFGAEPTASSSPAGAPEDPAAGSQPAPAPDAAHLARAEADRRRAEAQAQAARARAQARADAAQVKAQAARQAAEARTFAAQQRAAQARAVAAERAARPVTKGAGGGTVGIVFGLLLIAGALLIAADRAQLTLPWPFDGSFDPGLAWFGVALVVIGAGIVISGIRGRSSGWLGFLAIVGLGIAVPWSLAANDSPWIHTSLDSDASMREVGSRGITVSEGTTVARSIEEAERGFRASFGDPTIDLTTLDLSDVPTGSPVEVPVELTAGDLTIRVPRDVAVEADVRLWAGQVRWQVDGESRRLNRVGGGTAHLISDEAVDDGAVLRLIVSARAGNITIEED